MSVGSELAAGRRAAERRMSGRCRITRLQEVTLDTVSLTLTDDDPSDDLIYEGPFRLRSTVSRVTLLDREGQLIAMQQSQLSIPITADGVQNGDRVEIVESPDDPDLAGRRFRIAGLPGDSQATAHRFIVETA